MTGLWQKIAGLHPAYFAMVMATGIVSIAAQLLSILTSIVPTKRLQVGAGFLRTFHHLSTLSVATRHSSVMPAIPAEDTNPDLLSGGN